MIERLVEYLGDHGCVVEPEAMAYLARQPDPEAHIQTVLSRRGELPFYLTLGVLQETEPTPQAPPLEMDSMVEQALRAAPDPSQAGYAAALRPGQGVRATDVDTDVQLLKDRGRANATEGQIADFVHYFNDRFDALTKLLRRRREVANAVPIRHAHRQGKTVQLIGFISETSTTPNGHVFLTLEDDTDSVSILLHKDNPALVEEARTLVPDEVVGVVAATGREGDLLIGQELVRPDIPLAQPRPEKEPGVCAAILSDIHVGSNTFLPEPFAKMIDWLHGKTGPRRERELAARVKYLVLAGDIVDGVGIYPGQEDALDLTDILGQYERLARLLDDLPDHVHLVVQPGNHDAVRPTEPQPPLGAEIQELFADRDATFVSNPSTFRLHGTEILSYHGFSMVDFATRVPGLRMDEPIPIMRRMLQSRHIAPVYGGATPLSPEEKDYLVVDRVPDVFVTGHVHVAGLDSYRGVTLVNSGTWQEQTDYQKIHNLTPTPARMPVLDLGTLKGTLVDFGA